MVVTRGEEMSIPPTERLVELLKGKPKIGPGSYTVKQGDHIASIAAVDALEIPRKVLACVDDDAIVTDYDTGTVSVMLPNTPEMVEAHYAVPALNAVLNTLNTRLDAPLLAWQMNHCEAKVLITDREFAPVMAVALRLLREEFGRELIKRLIAELEGLGILESSPEMMGSNTSSSGAGAFPGAMAPLANSR